MASARAQIGAGTSGAGGAARAIQDTDGFIYEAVPELAADVGATPDDDDLRAVVSALMRDGGASAPAAAAAAQQPQQPQAPQAAPPKGPRTEQLPSVADDFIRNFMIRTGMNRALDCFNNEWYELKQKGRLPGDDARAVPDVYAQNQRLEDASALLRVELAQATEVAAKAQSTWDRFRRERDFHRMHHKRVVHEKNRLVVDLKRLKAHFEQYEPTIEELRVKYELAMKEKMLVRLEKDRLAARIDALETQLRQQGAMTAEPGAGGGPANVIQRSGVAGAAAAAAAALHLQLPGAQTVLARTGLQAPTASSRARVEERFATGPLPNVQAKALAAATAEAAALARATRVPDTKVPVEDAPNPYLGLAFDPARTNGYKLTGTVKAHGASVSALAFHPTRPIFASTSDDCLWRVWSVQSAQEAELLMNGEGHRTWLAGVDFHPAGDRLATCSGDGVVKLWNLATASCAATFSEHLQTCWGVAFHHSGDFLASASMDHSCKLWDVHTGRVRQSMRGHEDSVNAVCFQPFSLNLATASGDKSVSVWDARSGQCIQTFFGHRNAVNGLCFSTRGDTIASCDADGVVKLWDVKMVRERASLSLGRQPVHCVVFDRSAQVLACACDDGVVRVLDSSGAAMGGAGLAAGVSLRGHEDSVQSVAFDPTSQYLISAGSDATVRIWSEGAIKGVGLGLAATGSPGGRGFPDGDDA